MFVAKRFLIVLIYGFFVYYGHSRPAAGKHITNIRFGTGRNKTAVCEWLGFSVNHHVITITIVTHNNTLYISAEDRAGAQLNPHLFPTEVISSPYSEGRSYELVCFGQMIIRLLGSRPSKLEHAPVVSARSMRAKPVAEPADSV